MTPRKHNLSMYLLGVFFVTLMPNTLHATAGDCVQVRMKVCEEWKVDQQGHNIIWCSQTGGAETNVQKLAGAPDPMGNVVTAAQCGKVLVNPNDVIKELTAFLTKAGYDAETIKELLRRFLLRPGVPVPCGELWVSDTPCGAGD